MSGLCNKGALPIHVFSWALAIEKDSSVACHFAECQFMAISLEDMGKHHAQCLSDNSKYPFVCENCGRRTDVIEKLLLHREYSHSYVPTVKEKRMIDDYLNKPIKKVITPIIRRYWDLYLEQKKYLKCLWRHCLYVTDNIEDMENHYLNFCKKTYWSKLLYQCEFCQGRLSSDNDLQSHIKTAHESKTYLKLNTRPNTDIDCVKVWSGEIQISKQAKCLVPECRFVDNNIKILEKHYASCIGKKRSSYSVCTSCDAWLQNEARLKEHNRCLHKSTSDDNLLALSSNLKSDPGTAKMPIIYEMCPDKYNTLQEDVGVEMDNNRGNVMKKRNGISATNSQPGIYNNDIIKTNADILDVTNNDSPNVKKVLNDSLATTHKKITRRRSTSSKTSEKSLYPISTPLQVFANEIMKENKNNSTVPIQIKVDDQDWTVNVSKTVVTQQKSSDEFPENREALFQALKGESYKLLKLISKKNSVRNDVRMVVDPDETRVTPFHINFKINENNSETTGDDSRNTTRLHTPDAESTSSSDEDIFSDKFSSASERLGITTYSRKKLEANDNNLPVPSVLNNSKNVASGSDISQSDISCYDGPHNDNSVIQLPNCSNEENLLLDPRSTLEGTPQYTIQRLYSNFEQIQHERQQRNCKISPEYESGIKDQAALNDQCTNQLYSTDLDCNIPQENFVIKEELNEVTIVPVSSTDEQSVEVMNGEVCQNNNGGISVNNTVCQGDVLAANTFESEYILPDIDYVNNQTSFRCTTERMASLEEDSNESKEVLSEDEVLGNSINEISNNDINPEVNGIDVRSDKAVRQNNDLPSSFHCLDTNNKRSNQIFVVEKDPLCMDGLNEGIIFRDSETDLFQLSNENLSDPLDNRPDEDADVTKEKSSCSISSKSGVNIIGNESSDKQVNNFDSKWNSSNLKMAKNNSSVRMENIQHITGKADKKQVEAEDEDENFFGFSDNQDSSLNYSKFVNTCNKLGYYDDMVIFNQHYEVSQSDNTGSKDKIKLTTKKKEISNITFSENCNRMKNPPELSNMSKKCNLNKRSRSYSSPVMSNAISESDVIDNHFITNFCNQSDNSVRSIIKPMDFIKDTIDYSKPPVKKKRGRPRKLSLDSLQDKMVDQVFMSRMSLGIQNIDNSSDKNDSQEVDISCNNSSNPITEHKIDNLGPLTKKGPGRPKKFKPDIYDHTISKQILLLTQETEKRGNYLTDQLCDASDNLFDRSNFTNIKTKCHLDLNDKKIISNMSGSREHMEIKSLDKSEIKTLETSYAEEIIVKDIENKNKNTEDNMNLVANKIDNSVKTCPGRSKKARPKLIVNNTIFGVQEIEQENIRLVSEGNSNISETKCPSDGDVKGIFDHLLGNSDLTDMKNPETDRVRLVEISKTKELFINKPSSHNKNMVPFEGDISGPNTTKAMNFFNDGIFNSESIPKQSPDSPKKVTQEPQTKESSQFIKEVRLCQSGITINEEALNTYNKLSTITTESSWLDIGLAETSTPIQKNIPPFNGGIILNDNIGLVENESEPDTQKTSPGLLNRSRVRKRKASSLLDNYFLTLEKDSELHVDETNNESVIKKVNTKNESSSFSEKKNMSTSETAKEDIIDSYKNGAASLQKNCLPDNFSPIHQTRNQISCIEPPLKRRSARPKKSSLVRSQKKNQNKLPKTYSTTTLEMEQRDSFRARNTSKNTSHEEPADKTFLSPLTFIKGMDSNMSVSEMFINDFKKLEGNIDSKVKEIDSFQPKIKRFNASEVILKPAFTKDDYMNQSEIQISLIDAKETNERHRFNSLDDTNEYIAKRNDDLDRSGSHIKNPVESDQSVVQKTPGRPEPTHLKDEHSNQSVSQTFTRLEELNKTSEVIPSEANKTSEVIPSEANKTSEVIPSEANKMSEVLPSEANKTSEVIPSEANKTSEVIPSEANKTSEVIPSEANKTSEVIPSEAKKNPGRPKKHSLEPDCTNEEFVSQTVSQMLLSSSKINEIVNLNVSINNEKEVVLEDATVSEELILTPVEDLQPVVKRKRGRPKKLSLEPLWSNEECDYQSTGQTSFLANQETDLKVATNCDRIKNEEEIICVETPCTRSEMIDTLVVKRKRGRPKKHSLEPMLSDEDCENQETDVMVASNCDSIKNGEKMICVGTPCTRSEMIDTSAENLKPVVKRKRGRPKKHSVEPMLSDEELENQETDVTVASNCDSIKNGEKIVCVETLCTRSEITDTPVVKRKRGRPKKQSVEPMWLDEEHENLSTTQTSLLRNQETDLMVSSNCNSIKNEGEIMCLETSRTSSETLNTPVEDLQPAPKKKRGRPKKQSLQHMEECENQSTIHNIHHTNQETNVIVASYGDSIRDEEEIIGTPVLAQKKRGRPKKTLPTVVDLNGSDLSAHFSENVSLVDLESAICVDRSVRREKRASALSCMSFIKSEFNNISDDDEEEIQNFNATSSEVMILSDSAEFIQKKRGRKRGWKKNSDHWSRNRIPTKTNYIIYNSQDSNAQNSKEIQEHTIIDSNSTLDVTFESESDFGKSTRDEGDLSKEMANEDSQTLKKKARKIKKELLSGRVDTLTLLEYTDDLVKCAVCGEKMRVEDYQKSHLKKHNFVAWLDGEEPLPVHDFDYMDTVLVRGKRSHPKFIFQCEVCGQLKKSSKGYLSHRQFCGKTEREKEKIMVVCKHCGRTMIPASLAQHIYKHHKADANPHAPEPEETGPLNVSRKAAERCLGKIASYVEEDDNTPSKNDSENEDFQHDVDGNEEFDEIEEITLLYIPVQKKKANKCLINRWKKHASKNREIKCPGPSCQFTTLSFDNILEHHKTCISAGFQGYSCIKCNFICISEEEIRGHVKSCNPPIIVSQSDNSEDEVPEKHVMIPYLRAEELSLVYQRYKCQFFKPALNWMKKIYMTHFSQEPLFHDLKLNIESWKEMDMKTSQYFNPEKSKSMKISFQNSPWESMHALEGKVVDGNEGIAFTGGPVWGLEWCPGEGDQYLAVSSHLTMESNFQAGCTFNGPGIVQLWSLEDITNAKNDPLSTLQFSYSVCHNERACWNMAWCPSGGRTENRIGLLALATTSGSIPIYAMPDPKSLVPQLTRFYKPDPVLKLELWSTERWQCNAICWSKVKPHSIIAAGFVNGVVAVWDLSIESSLLRKKNILHPFKVFQAHHSIVTGVCLSPENNEYLATTSYDKSFKFWDLKDTTAPQSVLKRGLFTSVDWLRHWMAAVTTYDNAYTMLQTSVSLCPLRGFVTPTLQVVNNINSTSWSVTVNDWLNGAISSYDNGQVVLFLALKQTAYHHMEKRKYTKIILESSLHSFENGDGPQNKSGLKKKDEEADQNNIPSNSYEEAIKKYGLAINTDLAVGRNDKFQSKNLGSLNDIYPMASINRAAWNTNRQSFLYVAMGYQSGFLVVSKLSFPTVDQHAIDEISK